MKNLVIIGARGFGREIYYLALNSRGYGIDYDIKGFLDDHAEALEQYPNYPDILSSVEQYVPQKDDVFICALGDVHNKQKYVEMIKEKKGAFISLIHKSVHIGINTEFGEGCIFSQFVNLSCDLVIGDFVTIQPFSEIGHDARIGKWCHLNTYAFMGGFSTLEESVTIHTGGIVLPHKCVEKGAVVGAGSVVIKKVKAGTTVFGIPAADINK